MIRKLITTTFLAGILAIGLGGCDWCCGDAPTEGATTQGAECVDCDSCYECDFSTPEAPASGVAADAAAGAASCGLDMECGVKGGCSDELIEACATACEESADAAKAGCSDAEKAACAEKASCESEPLPECDSGGCSDGGMPQVPLGQ